MGFEYIDADKWVEVSGYEAADEILENTIDVVTGDTFKELIIHSSRMALYWIKVFQDRYGRLPEYEEFINDVLHGVIPPAD